MNNKPISFDEINEVKEDLELKTINEWGEEWYNSILPEHNKISILFEKWNKEFKGKLRAKLMLVLGYGGSKKSLLGQNILYDNIVNSKNRVIYSTMEMGVSDLINRFIDMRVEGEQYNSSFELELLEKKKKGEAMNFYKEHIAPAFGDKLFITQNASMTAQKYDNLLAKCKKNKTPIDILLVDGLGMMGGKGTDTEKYTENSKTLKELAKKWNILVILICHVSRGGKKTDRDLSTLLRSSEKIYDNCDFYVTMSEIEKNNGGEIVFDEKFGYSRLVNKRGSGRIIDTIFSFNKRRLFMNETDLNINNVSNSF